MTRTKLMRTVPLVMVATFAVGLTPAHAGNAGIVAPYQTLPGTHSCDGDPVEPTCENTATSDATGRLTTVAEVTSVLSDGRAAAGAGVMARHTLVQPVQEVTYTVTFDVDTALATASDDAGGTGQLVVSVAGPAGCGGCSASTVEKLVDAAPGATASLPDGDVTVEVTLTNGTVEKVPSGQVEIRVRLEARSTATSWPELGFLAFYIDGACGASFSCGMDPLNDPFDDPPSATVPAHARVDVDGVVTRIGVAQVVGL